jgi:hypothetical protein
VKRAGLALAIVTVLAVGLATWLRRTPAGPRDTFAAWYGANRAEAEAYLAFLHAQGVGKVLPPRELFLRGRRWQACGGHAYAAPPRSRWPAAVPTLKLIGELRARGLLDGARAVSAYRSPAFNACEGGSAASRHLRNQAFDLEWTPGPGPVKALCAAWRRDGAGRGWGLGFYTPGRIHVDTAGFRTWGSDYHAATSLCLRPGG